MSRFGAADISETFEGVLEGCAKTVAGLGAFATLVCVGLLVFTVVKLGGGSPSASDITDGARNVEIFQKVLIAGVVGLSIGATFLFWGEEFLGAGQLVLAGALFFAPLYLPSIFGGGIPNEATEKAMGALQIGGTILGVLGLLIVMVDVSIRVNQRVKTGTKADHLK